MSRARLRVSELLESYRRSEIAEDRERELLAYAEGEAAKAGLRELLGIRSEMRAEFGPPS